jgi:hypothetical protein
MKNIKSTKRRNFLKQISIGTGALAGAEWLHRRKNGGKSFSESG